MTIDATSTLIDVALAVCTALHKAGTTAVLTGGSAATFYAPEAYQSADLDFVITFNSTGDSEVALLELGFEREADYYRHPMSVFPLEFPPGPLMVGADVITDWHTEHRGQDLLHVLRRRTVVAIGSLPFCSGTTSAAWNRHWPSAARSALP